MCKSRFVTNSIFFDHKLKIRKSVKKLARTGTFRATTAAPLPTSHLSLRRFLSLSLSLCVYVPTRLGNGLLVLWLYGRYVSLGSRHPSPRHHRERQTLSGGKASPIFFPCVWVTTRSGYVWHVWPVRRPPDDRWAAAKQCQASYS